MVEKKKRKSNVEGGKKLLKFLKNEREDLAFLYKRVFFSKSNATCPILNGTKGPTFFL